ncbi:hypothetical protein AABM26_04685 [Curtobacterium aetherium]|uniref:hypothetical protein n=1 Tax=Curtobacterium aetherium TaxID=2841594 RepID=UPI003B51E923
MTVPRTSTAWLTALLVPVLLAGCSTGPSPSAPSSPSPAVAPADVGACLREHGYAVEDPGPGTPSAVPDGVDPDTFAEDLATCSGGPGGAGDAPESVLVPEPGHDAAVACIREQGYPDYPDTLADQRRYEPADQDTFDQVVDRCWDQARAER